jgi:uncharacterized phage protein gp47/JayE
MRTKTFAELLSGYTTAVQASASGLVDFTVGSILRACGESIAQVGLWLQGLILAQVSLSRASTSTGADLDSWMADFGLVRLGALKATGYVTFSRFSTTAAGLVPTGATVETTDGSQEFVVLTDTGNAAWNTGLGGYVLPIGTASVTVPVKASKRGAAGNVLAGAVTQITSNVPGIDKVVNAAVFSGGADVEADAAFRLRFQLFINSLSRSTVAAVANATAETTGVTSYTITENEDPDGTPHDGFFYVVIDDGSGAPANSLVNAVTAAVEAVRPVGTTFDVVKPTLLTAAWLHQFRHADQGRRGRDRLYQLAGAWRGLAVHAHRPDRL